MSVIEGAVRIFTDVLTFSEAGACRTKSSWVRSGLLIRERRDFGKRRDRFGMRNVSFLRLRRKDVEISLFLFKRA